VAVWRKLLAALAGASAPGERAGSHLRQGPYGRPGGTGVHRGQVTIARVQMGEGETAKR